VDWRHVQLNFKKAKPIEVLEDAEIAYTFERKPRILYAEIPKLNAFQNPNRKFLGCQPRTPHG
jgi:hypothetical protein